MRQLSAFVILTSVLLLTSPAHATNRHRHHHNSAAAATEQPAFSFFNPFAFNATATNATAFGGAGFGFGGAKPAYAGGPGGRPRAWCGWWARQQVGADPGPSFNLVASWRKWGSSSGPVPGAVAIWRGARHVGKVVSVEGGEVCTTSGNSGRGGVNTRCEPLSHFEQFRI
jgi:hypothetical protein